MHTGAENHTNRTRQGGRQRFLQRERPGPVLLSLGAGRVAQHAHWQERGLTHLLPSASEGKTLKTKSRALMEEKRKAENFTYEGFGQRRRAGKSRIKGRQNIDNLFLLG